MVQAVPLLRHTLLEDRFQLPGTRNVCRRSPLAAKPLPRKCPHALVNWPSWLPSTILAIAVRLGSDSRCSR